MKCVLIGAGGHALSVLEAVRSVSELDIVGIVDADKHPPGYTVGGVPVVGQDSDLPDLLAAGVSYFLLGIGSIGPATNRRKVAERVRAMGFEPLTVVHKSAVVSSSAKLGAGCQILAGAVVGPQVNLAEGVIVNTGAIVEHDSVLGSYSHVASGAVLAGSVRVGSCVHIGAGSVVRQSITIADQVVVGIGSAVVKDVPYGAVIAGVPAEALRHA